MTPELLVFLFALDVVSGPNPFTVHSTTFWLVQRTCG